MKKNLLFIIPVFLISVFSKATIINVPANYPAIQAAILAAIDGDTVLVEPGTYFENLNFRGRKIVLTSRYYLNSDTAFIKSTIINGNQPLYPDTASCVILNSGEDSTTVLQGFTITGGAGTVWSDIHGAGTYREGGGVLTELSSPVIQNNLIIYNNTAGGGAGVVSAGGGGIRIGDGQPTVRNNVIAFNTGRYGAGVVLNYTGVYLQNNLICYNSGAQDYGGAGIWTGGSIVGHNKYIFNNTIANNHTSSLGGGIIINSTAVIAKNNIFWGNTAAQVNFSQIRIANGGSIAGTYNDVQVNLVGTGNINANPMFTDSVSFYLPASSPAVDAGDSSLIYNDIEDVANPGNALFPAMNTLRNDMGVYGGQWAAILPTFYFIPVGLPEQFNFHSSFYAFPNPVHEQLNVNYFHMNRSTVQLRLLDMAGKLHATYEIKDQPEGHGNLTIYVRHFPKGMYLIWLIDGETSVQHKVLID